MIPRLAPLVIAALTAVLSLARLDDKFAAARTKFVKAAAEGSIDEKKAAMAELIQLSNPDAAAVLAAEYGRGADELRRERETALQTRYSMERRQAVLENLKVLAQQDASVKDLLPEEEKRIKDLQSEVERAQKKIASLEPWRDALAEGMVKLFETLGPARRRKSEDEVAKDAQEHPDTLLRAASIELLGRVGAPGTAIVVHDLLLEADGQIDKLRVRIAKSMAEVRKMEKRLQEEQAANGGRQTESTVQQYDQARKEAADATTQSYKLGVVVEACQRAGGVALTRESGKELEKAMQKLVASLRKGKDRARIDTLGMLLAAQSEAVRTQARTLLAAETEPLAIATLIEGLSKLGDKTIEADVIAKYLVHDSWLVRSRSCAALARLRSRAAVPAMIARLETEQGRMRTDLNDALVSLTGQNFRPVAVVWQTWWKDKGESFVVPDAPPEKSAADEAKEASGVTFFGIRTESQRVLFVLDLSRSMNFAMIPKTNPDDDQRREPDMPGSGESSRLEVAKRDLVKALGGIKDSGIFNIVLFASDVWTWADDMVTMTPDVRSQALSFIDKVEAIGGTNIYGALERALDLAGATSSGQWSKPTIDTIFFLSDGRASVGVTTQSDEILSFVRERNANAGITIHTIGLSGAHDAALLRRLAEENGGQYVGR